MARRSASQPQRARADLPARGGGDHVDRIVAEWAHELPDLDTDAIAVIGRLMRASRLLQLEVERSLAMFELTINEFNTLNALRRAGPPHRLSPKDVSVSLLFSSGGLTKLLERLESRGLIAREPNPDDGRGVFVSLTQAGKKLQADAMAAHQVNEEALLTPLTPGQREQLNSILRDLLMAFEVSTGRVRLGAAVAAAAPDGFR
jgi:DNA-binding MarR family transcriptional regulator